MAVQKKKPPPSRAEGDYFAAKRRATMPAAIGIAAKEAPASASDHHRNKDDDEARLGTIESYETLWKVGEGAFGAVTKARHRLTGEVVAIKSSRDGIDGATAAALLLREAALLAACRGNPAVVALREVVRGGSGNSDEPELHLVLEYVGPSLRDVLRARRHLHLPFTEPAARRAMADLLAGAGAMHAHGVVHRDLKPGNVLVGERGGRFRICDLGLAVSAAAPAPPRQNQQPEGTPGYMAPEVLLCENGGGGGAPAVDMWALGCIMAELVMGQPLFPGKDMCQQLFSIVELLGVPDDVSMMPMGIAAAAPSRLREKVPEERLSPAGFDVLRGLLEYHPMDRLTAAAALRMLWFRSQGC